MKGEEYEKYNEQNVFCNNSCGNSNVVFIYFPFNYKC